MNFTKKLLLLFLFVFLLTGCNNGKEVISTDEENNKNDKISLNVQQANLISSITDNIKYLNQDLLFKIDQLDDSDNVNIIINMKGQGLADSYNEDSRGYNTLSEFANSGSVSSSIKTMNRKQQQLINTLLEENYINEVKHTYTTLFNGFSANTTYGQFKALEKAGYDIEVVLSEVYSEPEYKLTSTDKDDSSSYETVTNYVNVYETGIFNSSGVGYDGANTAVAILDSGFDVHHSVFKNMPTSQMITLDDIEDILYDSKAYEFKKDIKAQDVYLNSKIPFVYDYADKDPDVAPFDSDHGTHVAGIIGGLDDVITGVAVNTQLVLMKVFGDVNNGAIQDDILAALEDAVLLGVDAINLSLGTACGFARSGDNEYINVVYDKIEAAGISLVVAASNDYSSGYGGENSNTNKASNPDSATVGSPGSFAATISVASISGVKSRYMVDKNGYTFFFNESNDNAGEPYDFYDMIFEKLGTNDDKVEVEYVAVPGVGKKINYANVDVTGKIALVKRGDTSFEEKAQVALSQGAIGCIIYNNVAGDVFMNAGGGLKIALASISKDDGEYLASKGSGKLILNKSYLAGPFMSEFSSWGPISNLTLKPEITAHGGSILSSVPGGGYDEISGTSMACPNLCGVVILVRQALKERYPDLSAVELTELTNQLLMSTATIILDERGIAYSPRKQGSGLSDLESAVETLAYLSVDGSKKAKIELKDDPEEKGIYELKFNINNTSNKELKYTIDDITMTESLNVTDPEYVSEAGYLLNPSTKLSVSGDGSADKNVIVVNPNGTVEVTYVIELSQADHNYMKQSFVNGMYVEGFVKLESLNEDEIDLNMPFLAFYGDWTVAPMFDKTYYEVESEAHNGAIDEEDKIKADYYATTPLGTYYYSYIIPLGSYLYEMDESKYDPIPASEELAAIGYDLETINGITTVYAGLLRNAKKMTTVIKNADTGEVVYEHVKYDQHKAYFSGSIIPAYDLINVTAFDMGLQNNTQYTFTMEAELDYKDGGKDTNLNNQFEFSFYVDFEAPIITDAQFYTKYNKSEKEYEYYVDVYVYDNHYAQSIRPFTIVNGELVSLVDYVIPIYNQGKRGEINKVTVEITDYMDLLQYGTVESGEFSLSNGLGFLVDDYALNQTYSYVTLPGTNSKEISYKEDYYSSVNNGIYQYNKKISIGDTLDLAKMITSTDLSMDANEEVQTEYFRRLDWASSDENVIKVKDGQIEAVGAGSAIVTCTSMNSDGYVYSASLKIDVRDRTVETEDLKLTDIQFTYFDTLKAFVDGPEYSEIGETGDRIFFTEKPVISCYPSEQVQIGFELEPWNLKNYELIWSSTNEKVATVDEKGIVTALKEGSTTITLKVKVNGKVSTLMDSVRVFVKNEFIIEGTTLVAYKGMGGDVVIPDDEGILYIGAFAFSLYTTDYEIKIEDDNYDAAKTPEANTSVTSVVIPADVKEVQRYAFYNCTALEEVTFLIDEEGDSCNIIRDHAFYGDTKLTKINLENVQMIGDGAFYNCTGLTDIDLSKVISMGRRAFAKCTNLTYVDITELRNVGPEIFLDCKALTTIDSGEFTNFASGMFKNSGLTSINYMYDRIPDSCFDNCKNLTDVTINNSLVYIGKGAFNNCLKLTNVEFKDGAGCEFIYDRAFNNCIKLESITLPDSSFELEKAVFNKCTNLSTIIFNKNSMISANLGSVFSGCNNIKSFVVDEENPYYTSKDNLLLNKEENLIVLAAPGYDYGTLYLDKNVASGAFSSIESIKELVIGENVEYIDSYGFENCKLLEKITINSSNTLIKEGAFSGCSSLKEIVNIDLIKVFDKYVFASTALTSVIINGATILEGAFSEIKTLTDINITTSEKVGDDAFSNCPQLNSAVINALEIGKYTFANCSALTTLNIDLVEKLDEGAFICCSSLEVLSAPNLKVVGDYAFCDNTKLNSITLDSVEVIGDNAFASTDKVKTLKVTSITFGDTLKSIGSYAFNNAILLETVSIGSGLETIGSHAFMGCSNLKSFDSLGSVEVISEYAFADDANLKTVNIPGILYIKDDAFVGCNALEEIDLTNVIEIGIESFYYCVSLTELNMPNVEVLNAGAFLLASKVKTVYMPKVKTIDAQALSCIDVEEIILPDTVTYISPTAFYYNQKQVKFTDQDGNDTVRINDYVLLDQGVLYTVLENGKYVLNAYPTAKSNTEYEVLFNTVRVADYAGCGNTYLEKVIFPDTLKLIANNAFYTCKNLATVEFKSTTAPVLEGTVSMTNIEYENDCEAYKLLNKYFPFNGYYPLFYSTFNGLVGTVNKMKIIVPKNADMDSFDNVLFNLYFDIANIEKSSYEGLNARSIDYLEKVAKIPTHVVISDEKIIKDAKTAYNLLNQDLTKYGYSQEYLDELYNKLIAAEEKWLELKMSRVNKIYAHLIEAINNLGSTYQFDKISAYYDILDRLELVDASDIRYIDRTNVDSFKDQFDEYFDNLTDDVNVLKDMTTLPTSKVNKVGLIVVSATSLLITGLAFLGIVLKRRVK